ncbi:MAG: SGNH/GDSL hydrolase family protein [Parasporobacterium sp.]|nr:SGNH/GDSL hydrolase family protein [Parasporobacterium sp.]
MKNNNKDKPKRKGHYDEYRAAVSQLDDKTKNKLELQRALGMMLVVVVAIGIFCILVFTGVGVDKNRSVSGNVFADLENVLIECFGDSITEGYTVSEETGAAYIADVPYPEEMKVHLSELLAGDGNKYKCSSIEVRNFGQSGSILQKDSCARLSGKAHIVIILYTSNNFMEGVEYEGTLESNIDTIMSQGSQVFLMNYPVKKGTIYENKLLQANNYISSVAGSRSVQFIDAEKYFNDMTEEASGKLFSPDGVHLTEEGYRLLGDYAAEVIHEYYRSMY